MSSNSYRNDPRRRFSHDFTREVVEILLEQTATVAEVARVYDINPRAYLCHVLTMIADHLVNRIDELLPWNVALTNA